MRDGGDTKDRVKFPLAVQTVAVTTTTGSSRVNLGWKQAAATRLTYSNGRARS